eukprot:6278848-Amphidinium_carterae.1
MASPLKYSIDSTPHTYRENLSNVLLPSVRLLPNAQSHARRGRTHGGGQRPTYHNSNAVRAARPRP